MYISVCAELEIFTSGVRESYSSRHDGRLTKNLPWTPRHHIVVMFEESLQLSPLMPRNIPPPSLPPEKCQPLGRLVGLQKFPRKLACVPATRAEESFRILIKSIWNQMVFTIFQLIWNQTDVRLVPNQSEKMQHKNVSVCVVLPVSFVRTFAVTLAEQNFCLLQNWEKTDRSDSFIFEYELNWITYGSWSKGKLSPCDYISIWK